MNEFEEYRIMSDEYRQEWLSPKIPNLTEEKIVGNDHYSVNRPPVEEDTIANIIIDVLKSIPLSDISYRRIQVELFKGRKKYLPEPYESERMKQRKMENLISRHTKKISPFLSYPLKDFISEDEMEI